MAFSATVTLLVLLPGHVLVRVLAAVWCMALAAHAFSCVRRERTVRIGGCRIQVDGIEGEVVDGSFVAPWLTIVHWRPPGARFTRTLLVLPDMLDPEPFRALRVILRWEGKIRG